MVKMENKHFYKIFISDIDNIINDKTSIGEFLILLKNSIGDGDKKYLSYPNTFFYICFKRTDYFGWMPKNMEAKHFGLDGYKYFIELDYKYGGEYISNKMLRKIKLEKLNG